MAKKKSTTKTSLRWEIEDKLRLHAEARKDKHWDILCIIDHNVLGWLQHIPKNEKPFRMIIMVTKKLKPICELAKSPKEDWSTLDEARDYLNSYLESKK